jgi:hypothetical protein
MTFLHAAFLAGAAAIVVPIVLHLVMRRQPKHLEFPALRFLKLRQQANRRQIQLRHWLLLALRCGLILALALALARPSIVGSGMLGDQEAPVAAALVFDTTPRMQYRQQNKTRLEVAQETAEWLLAQLPAESNVAVIDSRANSAAFAVDAAAARQRVQRLTANAVVQPLAIPLQAALKLLEESDKPRKELYIFTDLARAAWSTDAMRDLEAALKKLVGLGVYVIDVGVADPTNFGLADLKLSGQVLSKNSPLTIGCDLVHVGAEGQRWIELNLIDRQTGKLSNRGQNQYDFQPGQSQHATFTLLGLGPGMHQGNLKIVGEDALSCDDTRWFTVEVRPAWHVLLVAPRDSDRDPKDYAFFLSEALAPYDFRAKGRESFHCDVISLDDLASKPLDSYAAVCLIDPRSVEPRVWQKLQSYVALGGGLGIFLGRNAAPVESFNEPIAQELMPGKLVRQWRAPDGSEVYLAPENFNHPVLSKLRGLEVAWEGLPVFRHWQLQPSDGAAVVLPFSDNQPALLERPVGKGRVLVMTTPVSDTASRSGVKGYEPWNLLPLADEKWPFVALANEMMFYLVGSGQGQLNYTSGETAVVPLDAARKHSIYSLTTPGGDQVRTPPNDEQNAIAVTSTEQPGNYRIQAGGGEDAVDLGFSVNTSPQVSRLERASQDELKNIFGDTPFRLARGRDEIDRSISAGRVGQELFPYLILLVTLILACEQVLANRFYQDYDTQVKPSRAAELAANKPPRTTSRTPVKSR